MPEFKMEVVAFFCFKDNLKHFLFCYRLLCDSKKPKAHQAQSAVTQCTVHEPFSTIHCFGHITFFHKVPLFHCVNITIFTLLILFVCFVRYCTSCTSFFFFVLNLPLDFVLFRFCENIGVGKRGRQGLKATVQLCY